MKIKNILILAGGDSTRFWPFENKIFTSFLGVLYIKHIFDQIKKISEKTFIVVNSNNKGEIEKIIGSGAELIVQNSIEGMGGAILSCKNKIIGETLILGNDLFDFSVLPKMIEKNREMVLLAKKIDSYFPGGYLKLDGDKISAIIEKPEPEKIPSNLVRLVADYLKDIALLIEAVERIKLLDDSAYEQGLTTIIKNNNSTYYRYDGYWYPIKYSWHILPIMKFFLTKTKKYIGKNVRISNSAKLVEPYYIGDNTIIGDFALVRESHIGESCIIGSYTEVARSYIGDKVMLHKNYVGDSVVGQGVMMGAGAVTANYRFDGKTVKSTVADCKTDSQLTKFGAIIGNNSKIGVNATILPGIKIGRNTWIGPGEIVKKDIEDNQFVTSGKMKRSLTLRSEYQLI